MTAKCSRCLCTPLHCNCDVYPQVAPVAWRHRNYATDPWIYSTEEPVRASPKVRGTYVPHDAEIEPLYAGPNAIPDLPQAVEVWRPIETAPQDGSEILILTSLGVTQARFAPGEWHDHQEGREYDGPVWVCCDDQWQVEVEDCGKDGMHHGMATHWQHLPSPLSRPEDK